MPAVLFVPLAIGPKNAIFALTLLGLQRLAKEWKGWDHLQDDVSRGQLSIASSAMGDVVSLL